MWSLTLGALYSPLYSIACEICAHYHLPCSQAIDCEKETFKIYRPKSVLESLDSL